MDKRSLIESLLTTLRAELVQAERQARDTADAANHPEARPEGDKDTRKVELSYLAAGQAARAADLETAVALLAAVPIRAFDEKDVLQAGAVVALETDGKPQRVLLCPAGGGLKLKDERGEISVVTPQAPLGGALLGKTVGDAFELEVAGRKREIEIVGVE